MSALELRPPAPLRLLVPCVGGVPANYLCAPSARLACEATFRRTCGANALCGCPPCAASTWAGLLVPWAATALSHQYGQPPLPVAALQRMSQPRDTRAGWAEPSDPAPALTSPPPLSVPTGDLPPTGYPRSSAGLQLPALVSKSDLTDPLVTFVPTSPSHLQACASAMPAGCRPAPEPTSDHVPVFPAVPTVSTDAAPLPTGHVPRTVPTLADILADDEFGAATSDTPYVADGHPRPDLAADVLRSLHASNTGLVCYLAYEGLRLSALGSLCPGL